MQLNPNIFEMYNGKVEKKNRHNMNEGCVNKTENRRFKRANNCNVAYR